MAPEGYTTYRVRGIPAGSTKAGAKRLIQRAAHCHQSDCHVKSLASDLSRLGEMVGTVTFDKAPESVYGLGGGDEWVLELPVSDEPDDSELDGSLVFDTHFRGCTTLYCPPESAWKFEYEVFWLISSWFQCTNIIWPAS